MSSPSDAFDCHWRASPRLLAAYLGVQALALFALTQLSLPAWAVLCLLAACLAHAMWCLPRQILLTHDDAPIGLRRTASGWALHLRGHGWTPVQLRPDSLAWPALIVLRYRIGGRGRVCSLCVPHDALDADAHRRLRVRLRFSRQRWAAPE